MLLPHFPLLKVMYFSQVANGMLLPLILIFMLRLINNRTLMGSHVNGPVFNVIAWTAVVVLVALTVWLVAAQLFGGA